MNLLPIVISLLLLMAAISYAQLASIAERTLIRKEYACFIQNHLRTEQNELQEELYSAHHIKGKSKEDPYSRAKGEKKINIAFFATAKGEELLNRPYRDVLNRLVDNLYSHRKFYQEAREHNENLSQAVTDAVLAAIQEQKEAGEWSTKFQSSDELSTLTLRDPFLNDLWQEMVRRVELPGSLHAECREKKTNDASRQEYEPNILDYLAIPEGERAPYRVWTAGRSLLEAIFPRPEVVDEIIKARKQMYNQLRKAKKEDRDVISETLKQTLEDRFGREGFPDLPDDAFDFTVSLSRPPRSRK